MRLLDPAVPGRGHPRARDPDTMAVADRYRSSRSIRKALGMFLLLNILPLAGAAYIGIQYWRGELEIRELPEGLTWNLVVLGAVLVLLLLVASLSLPAAHRAVREIETYAKFRTEILKGAHPGSRLLSVLALPFLGLAWVLAWPVRLVLVLLSLALVAVAIVFLVRLFVPDFCEAWIQKALELKEGWR